MTTARGTSNANDRGSAANRRARRTWLVGQYRADVDVVAVGTDHLDLTGPAAEFSRRTYLIPVPYGEGQPACRCYRCGVLLTEETLTVDRIIPGCKGGTYRRNNIRPACGTCNSITGVQVRTYRPAVVR